MQYRMHREKGKMEYFTEYKMGLVSFLVSLVLLALMFSGATNTVSTVSAVETEGVGVYWDSNCTDRVSLIDWEVLTPGSQKNIVVNIRNEVEDQMNLSMSTKNWNPLEAADYLSLRWSYNGCRVDLGETLQVTLILSVSIKISGISSFGFDITIVGGSLLGDANGDNIVDFFDLIKPHIAYGSKPGDSIWNPDADLNNDDVVDIIDVVSVASNFGNSV